MAPLASQFSTGPAGDWPDRAAISDHVDRLEELLGLWRGEPYADLADHPDVAVERSSLDQLQRSAEEHRALGLLALGDHAAVLAATEQAVARYPLQERVWAVHALALARSGRQAESLAALRHIRDVLAEELGLDPGQELRELEHAVLVQDPALQQWLRAPVRGAVGAPQDAAPVADAPGTAAGVLPGVGAPWGTYGREQEEANLLEVLSRAEAGSPAFAVVVGEPGIGKSRLTERATAAARDHGFRVATGRCSADEGAPPLWPWSQVLEQLEDGDLRWRATDDGSSHTDDQSVEARAFQTFEHITGIVLERARQQPLLVVLEDLHWADTATLRVLRHLVAVATDGAGVAVVGTRRPWPEPTGALADVLEELARRHVTRVDLVGLSTSQASRLVEAVCGTPVAPEVLAAWHARSGGNPFFLIELARLQGGQDQTPQGDQDGAAPVPATVRDVIVRRLGGLPDDTRELLLLAAVLGRRCSLDVLAAVAGRDPDEVDDLFAPARETGLVEDPEAGVVAFVHALTRDAVAATTTPSRLARLHARVAHALQDDPAVTVLVGPEERTSEAARHWLAAGPSYVGRAWRAASAAAEQARRNYSWVEAEQLMAAAIEAHRRDPLGSNEERIDLLLTRARDCRPNAEWDQVLPCAAEAIALARREEDLPRLAAAAAAISDNGVWLPQQWNQVLDDTVEDLRWALARLDRHDSADRCRVMLALALQLYYEPRSRAEIEALADEGAAMAQRIGDPALLWWASHTAWKALWTPAHADRRLILARAGLAATRSAGDPDSEAVALVVLTASVLELGDLAAYEQAAAETARLARRRRNSYVRMALAWLELSLASMRSDEADLARLAAELYELRPRLNPAMEGLHVAGIQVISSLWTEAIADLVEPFAAANAEGDDLGRDVLLHALARTGDVDGLRQELVRPYSEAVENWGTMSMRCSMAEVAAVAEDTALAQEMATGLAPLTGRMSVSGIAGIDGPVDGYLALALATTGRAAEATAAAERALEQADAWGLPAYTAWLLGLRARLGF